jgi:hypothetical protein
LVLRDKQEGYNVKTTVFFLVLEAPKQKRKRNDATVKESKIERPTIIVSQEKKSLHFFWEIISIE